MKARCSQLSEYPPFKHHNRLKELRKNQNLTLKQLGSDLGMRDSTLSQYENEKRNPSYNVWKKIAKYFQVSTAYLMGYGSDPDNTPDLIFDNISDTKFSDNERQNKLIQQALTDSFSLIWDEIDEIKSNIASIQDPNSDYDPYG